MQGNLERSNLPEILLNLHLARRNGILRLTRNDVKKSVYFLDGAIVFAHSNQKHDRLGETLLRLGKITQEEFENASREVIEKGKRLGQVLSELGYISAQEVNASVHYQLQQIIYSLFDWDSGDYEFLERERPVFEDIMIDVSTPSLILEGIRSITNRVVLMRAYQGNENQVLYLHSGAPRLPRSDFYFGEETILACVDGAKTIENVRQLSRLSEMEFDRSLCGLLLSGMLHFGKESRAPEPTQKSSGEIARPTKSSGEIARPAKSSGEIERPTKSSGEIARPTKSSGETLRPDLQPQSPFATQPMPAKETQGLKTLSEPEMRQLVFATIQKFQDATDEEILGVLPDSSLPEVNKAYDNLCANFHAPFYSLDRFLDIKEPLKAILDRAAHAHSNLIAKITARMPLHEAYFEGSERSPEMETQDSIPVQAIPQGASQKESISDLQEKVRKEPANTALLRRLGKRLYETGKPQESEKQYLKALELEPQSVENHLALAEFYTSMGLKIKAFKHLNIILQIQPNHERALEMLNLKKPSKKPLYEI